MHGFRAVFEEVRARVVLFRRQRKFLRDAEFEARRVGEKLFRLGVFLLRGEFFRLRLERRAALPQRVGAQIVQTAAHLLEARVVGGRRSRRGEVFSVKLHGAGVNVDVLVRDLFLFELVNRVELRFRGLRFRKQPFGLRGIDAGFLGLRELFARPLGKTREIKHGEHGDRDEKKNERADDAAGFAGKRAGTRDADFLMTHKRTKEILVKIRH